jgi:hypothetical protein
MASTVMIALADERRFETRAENRMLKPRELEGKFRRLTRRALGEPGVGALFERLQRLEDETDLSWLGISRSASVSRKVKYREREALKSSWECHHRITWATPKSIFLAGLRGERDGKIDLLTKEFDELLHIDIRQIDGQHLVVRASDRNDTI